MEAEGQAQRDHYGHVVPVPESPFLEIVEISKFIALFF